MRYSKAAASLLSTAFSFQAKSLVVFADIFDPIDHEAHVGARAPTKNKSANGADTGILSAAADMTPSSAVIASAPSTCAAANIVECRNGKLAGSATSCFDACGGNGGYCCQGANACDGFTGNVCKDGSCNGNDACHDADILLVVNSCTGDRACDRAGNDGGLISSIVDSCHGYRTCQMVAENGGRVGDIIGSCSYNFGATYLYYGFACHYLGRNGGTVGDVLNSCYGVYACPDVGHRGKVGDITGSCLGYGSCDDFGRDGGTVGNVYNSCNGNRACRETAEKFASIGDITSSCIGDKACYNLSKYGGTVGSITNSCTVASSCDYLAKQFGTVGDIKDSCTATDSCQGTASNRGSTGSILKSCRAVDACLNAGSAQAGAITSDIVNCCNTFKACELDNEATLPAVCKISTSSKVRWKCDAFAPNPCTYSPYNLLSLTHTTHTCLF
jgi:hypothetical protein